jgi:hypothetical protein
VIAMFVGEKNAIELVGSDAALGEAQDQLARAQSAIDQQPAMIGCDERAVPRAPAAEHRQSEHARLVADAIGILKRNCRLAAEKIPARFNRSCAETTAPAPSLHETILSLPSDWRHRLFPTRNDSRR